jgi:hypothetical protein
MEKALTPTEKTQLATLENNMKLAPRTFAGLSAASKSLITKDGTFVDEQREFFSAWWLEVDDKRVETINALMPENNVCEPRIDTKGRKWVSSDLLSDKRLVKILPELQALVLVNKPESDWPLPEALP